MKVRVKFTKHGSMKFIGHLDIMRYFQKAIRRSGLDVVYTEGFSPHQIMSFAAPLGVGLESNGEYMDIEMKTVYEEIKMVEDFNKAMADGIEIINMRKLPDTAGNAMASVQGSEYSIYFKKGNEPEFDYVKALPLFFEKETIQVLKQTKKSETQLDLKPYIYQLSIKSIDQHRDNKLDYDNLSDMPVISMTVDSSSSGNIKPGMVMEAFFKENNQVLKDFSYQIVREDTYVFKEKIMNQETLTGEQILSYLIPMDELGEEIHE